MEDYSTPGQPLAKTAGDPSLVRCVTLDDVQAVLQDNGYRVETATDESGQRQLRSATSGLPFFIRFGNALAGGDAYVDFTLYSVLRVEGDLPGQFTEEWNASRRFARLHRSGDLLVLQMDVSVLGGVARDHLSCLADVWDRLLNDLLRALRDRLSAPPRS